MTRLFFLFTFLQSLMSFSQTLNLNNPLFENNLRRAQLNGDIDSKISFTLPRSNGFIACPSKAIV